jgi:hypothetical protein
MNVYPPSGPKLICEQFPKTLFKTIQEGFSRAKRVIPQREGLIINPEPGG